MWDAGILGTRLKDCHLNALGEGKQTPRGVMNIHQLALVSRYIQGSGHHWAEPAHFPEGTMWMGTCGLLHEWVRSWETQINTGSMPGLYWQRDQLCDLVQILYLSRFSALLYKMISLSANVSNVKQQKAYRNFKSACTTPAAPWSQDEWMSPGASQLQSSHC